MIYLDNAATTLHKPPEVAEAVLRAMGTMGNGGRGVHGFVPQQGGGAGGLAAAQVRQIPVGVAEENMPDVAQAFAVADEVDGCHSVIPLLWSRTDHSCPFISK